MFKTVLDFSMWHELLYAIVTNIDDITVQVLHNITSRLSSKVWPWEMKVSIIVVQLINTYVQLHLNGFEHWTQAVNQMSIYTQGSSINTSLTHKSTPSSDTN